MIPTLNYIGPSMNPTLKAGDGLIVVAYEDSPIFVGDVVVFRHPEKKHRIAHRVVTVDSRGLTTRGDGNHRLDPWVLTRTDIIGRVVAAQRMTKKNNSWGGMWAYPGIGRFRSQKGRCNPLQNTPPCLSSTG